MLHDFFRLFQQSCRAHARKPGFSLLVVLTLALGLGCAIAICSVAYAFLLRPLPFDKAEQLLMLHTARVKVESHPVGLSYPDFEDIRREIELLDQAAVVSFVQSVTLSGGDQAEHLSTEFVSGNLFRLLGVEAAIGRTFTDQEDLVPSEPKVAVLSHDLWQRRFGGDDEVLGEQILLNDQSFTVVGVLRPSYRGTWWDPVDIWLPVMMAPLTMSETVFENRSRRWFTGIGRMKEGANLEQVEQALGSLAERLAVEYPTSNKGFRLGAQTQQEAYFEYIEGGLRALWFGGVLLLLLCCFNVASLLLTRGASRRSEVAVRSAMGARRTRLLIEKLVESSVLALAGGILGLLFATFFTQRLVGLSTIPTMNFELTFFDGTVVVVALVLTLVAGIIFGMAPAVQAMWSNLWRFLKQGGRSSPSKSFHRVLNSLLVVEVALAFVLLVAAAGFLSDFFKLRDADIGMATDELLSVRLDLTSNEYQEDAALRQSLTAILGQVSEIPGIDGAGLVGPYAPPRAILSSTLTIEDRLADSGEGSFRNSYRQYVSPGYFSAVEIPLVEGREFDLHDDQDAPLVAIISDVLAKWAWPDQSAIGRRLRVGLPDSESPWITVVGVAAAVQNRGPKDMGRGPDYDIYYPILQEPTKTPFLLVRSKSDLGSVSESLRNSIRSFDPEIPVYEIETMREKLAYLATDDRFLGFLMGFFAIVAALVAAIGVFGVLSYAVGLRIREFGIRRAIGASEGSVMGLVLRQGFLVLATGIALGWIVVFFVPEFPGAEGLTSHRELGVGIFMSLALLLVGGLAVLLPAFRSTQLTPTQALRYE